MTGRPRYRCETVEFARLQVATLSSEVAAGIRPVDDCDLVFWSARLTQLTNSNEGPPDAA